MPEYTKTVDWLIQSYGVGLWQAGYRGEASLQKVLIVSDEHGIFNESE